MLTAATNGHGRTHGVSSPAKKRADVSLSCMTVARSRGERTILFGGSGFLGPYILERCPDMVSVGRSAPPTATRHVHVDSLADLSVLDELDFDRVVFIIGNTDHHA